MYLDHGTYWLRPKSGKAVNLGPDLADALSKYAGIIETKWSGRALGEVIDRYRIEVLPFKRSEQTRKDEGRAFDRLKAVFADAAGQGDAAGA